MNQVQSDKVEWDDSITYIGVAVVNKHCQRRQNLTNHIHRRWRIFVAAQVHHDPRDIPEERQRNTWIDEGDEWLHDAEADDIITTLWPITCIKQSLNCCMTTIWHIDVQAA